MTDSGVWNEAKRILQVALELDAPAREAYVLRECAGAPDVLAEVRSLLEWHRASTGFLETPAGTVTGLPLPATDNLDLVGQSLGPWRIVDIIGRGGMGVVYLAERIDEAFKKPAAVKVVREDAASAEIVERFRRERETLAALEHQNISRVMDAGTTPSGQPYLVLEYVDGVPIDRYCDERRLGVDERLALFRQVCAAVQYAHQNLVVHRDIKPDNVLVSREGVPKLIDFGVAKLLSRESPDAGESFAETWLMTPDYASPEQVFGGPITTATDVYSLGVLLHVLLTGRSPYRLAGRTRLEVQDSLRGVGLATPSEVSGRDTPDARRLAGLRATTPARLRARLRGDLDAIMTRALAPDVGGRYQTADQLAADLTCHRTSRPVSARGTSGAYQAWTFVRRHTLAVSLAATVGVVMAAGMAGIAWQARVAAEARARAERRFDEVRRLAQVFIFDVHDAIVNVPGTTEARALMMRTAADYLTRLAAESGDDVALQRELASACVKVGDAQGHPTSANVGDTAGARRSYERAIAITDRLVQRSADDLDAARTLALAHRRLADVLAWAGDPASALTHTHTSGEGFRAIARRGDATADDRFQAGVAEIKLGDVLGNPNFPNVGRQDEALPHYQAALDLLRQLDAARPGDQRVRRYVGLTLERIGTMHEAARAWVDAEAAYRESFTIRRALAAAAPFHTDIQRDLAIAWEKVANVERATAGVETATASYRGALAQFESLARADPSNAIAVRSVAISREKLADALGAGGTWKEAVEQLGAALQAHTDLARRDPSNAQARCDAARVGEALGDTWRLAPAATERQAAACRAWSETMRVFDALQHTGVASCGREDEVQRLAGKLRDCR